MNNEQFRKKYRNTLNYLENANEYGLSIQYVSVYFLSLRNKGEMVLPILNLNKNFGHQSGHQK